LLCQSHLAPCRYPGNSLKQKNPVDSNTGRNRGEIGTVRGTGSQGTKEEQDLLGAKLEEGRNQVKKMWQT